MMSDRVLVVDLDGTLVRSNLLLESFWSSFARNWKTPIRAIQALFEGRSALKHSMTEHCQLEAQSLPYNEAVLSYVRSWRAGGGRCALVTAANQELANQVASHLGIFDEVHGSDMRTNLKGLAKADFLVNRFGDKGFDYIGDASADLPVWQRAKRAILVNVPGAVQKRLKVFHSEIVTLCATDPAPREYLRAMRPHQWLKNLLVFLPLLASHDISGPGLLLGLLAFASFSLVASSVYVLNDLLDLAADRVHPRKSKRPFASGAVPIEHGTAMAPILFMAGLLLSLPLGQEFVGTMLVYFTATLTYSLHFKRQPVIDICMLAGLYTLRIVAGGFATGTHLSVWIIAFSVFLFFSLAAVKRQAELVDNAAAGRSEVSGRDYHVSDLTLVASMATASGYTAILILGLYITSPDILALYARPYMLWGVCAVLFYWINRVVMLTHRGEMHDDPVIFAATDRTSQVCLGLMLLLAIAGTVG